MRKHRSLEERLADIQTKKEQIKAREQQLEIRKRERDRRTRGKAEMTLMRVIIGQMNDRPDFKATIAELVTKTKLRPDELEAIHWLMTTIDRPPQETAVPEDQVRTGAPNEVEVA